MKKVTLEQIQEQYHQNDICMGELLADISAEGLSIEDAFELYIKALNWSDGDRFFRKSKCDVYQELGKDNKHDYQFDRLLLSRFRNIDELKKRIEEIGAKVLSVISECPEDLDDKNSGFKQLDHSLLAELDTGEDGKYSHVTLYYYIDRQENIVITETAFCWE